MAILPVWCEGWALGCCGDGNPAYVGKRWKTPLIAHFDEYEPVEADLGWSPMDHGDVIVVGETYVSDLSRQPILDLGSIKIASKRSVAGRFRARSRIFSDWHADIDGGLMNFVSVEGLVLAVTRYPPIYEEHPEERVRSLVGYRPPVEMESTFGWLGYSLQDALVRLDVDVEATDSGG